MRTLFVWLLLAASCFGSVAFETSNATFDSSGTPVSSFPASPLQVTGLTGGETIVVFAGFNGGTASASDSAGGTLVSEIGPLNFQGSNNIQLWCEANAASGTHGVTISLTGGTTTFPNVWVEVFSGAASVSPCDAGNSGSGNSTALATAAWTATNPNEMIVAFGEAGGLPTAGSSPIAFTADSHAPGCNCKAEFGILAGSTAASATMTAASGAWGIVGITIKAPLAAVVKRPHSGWDAGVLGFAAAPPAHGQFIVWEDDCSSDICSPTLATAARLQSRGEATLIAVAGSTSNDYSEGALFGYLKYYGLSTVPVGATRVPLTNDASSVYTQTISDTFGKGPGDVRANYPDCITVYRTALADATYRSVVLVETGLPSCTVGLLNSPADSISPLTGAQLIQQKVKLLSVMGGRYPTSSGSAEFNFAQDPADMHTLVTTWTTQNGYPPIYFTGFDSGTNVIAGPPSSPPDTVNPVLKEYHLLGISTREQWDALAMLFAIRGLSFGGTTYFTDNGDGTLSVDAASGNDTWSATPSSGHHYLTNADTTGDLSALFNGFLAEIP